MELVSVIVPCFNSAETIRETLESIKEQSITYFECIIIDDFSTDRTLQVINSIIINDKRFKVISLTENQGVTYARNIGLKNANGRYLTFLDSDDIWHKDFLYLSLKAREKKDLAITHSSYRRFVDGTKYKIGSLINPPKLVNRRNILYKNHIPLLTAMIDKKIVGDIYFTSFRPEDYYLWCYLIRERNFSSISIDYPCAYYRISENQRSRNKLKALKRIFFFYKNGIKLNIICSLYFVILWSLFNSMERLNKIIKGKGNK